MEPAAPQRHGGPGRDTGPAGPVRPQRLRALIAALSAGTMLVGVLAVAGVFGHPAAGMVPVADVMMVPPAGTRATQTPQARAEDSTARSSGQDGGAAAGDVNKPGTAKADKPETSDQSTKAEEPVQPGKLSGSGTLADSKKLAGSKASGNSGNSAEPSYGRHADLRPLPAHSGTGKRIVFSLGHQQVWLVNKAGDVVRTYRVSGSKFNQVKVKTYAVTGRYRHTTSYLGDATMEFMVTFTHGKNAVIGFHAIPIYIKSHKPEQSVDALGKRLSAGCVRQYRADAKALWDFAPVGTPVDVVA